VLTPVYAELSIIMESCSNSSEVNTAINCIVDTRDSGCSIGSPSGVNDDSNTINSSSSYSYRNSVDNSVLKCKKLHPNAKLPIRGSKYAAGLDLHCVHRFSLAPGEKKRIGTGIAMEIPNGMEGHIRIRSSIGWKEVILLSDTIDSDYRDEVMFQLKNTSTDYFYALDNERLAQIVIKKVEMLEPVEAEELTPADRLGGFGSSGRY